MSNTVEATKDNEISTPFVRLGIPYMQFQLDLHWHAPAAGTRSPLSRRTRQASLGSSRRAHWGRHIRLPRRGWARVPYSKSIYARTMGVLVVAWNPLLECEGLVLCEDLVTSSCDLPALLRVIHYCQWEAGWISSIDELKLPAYSWMVETVFECDCDWS